METGIVAAFEEESPEPTAREEASASAFIGMLACNLILLLMLAACSPATPSHVDQPPPVMGCY